MTSRPVAHTRMPSPHHAHRQHTAPSSAPFHATRYRPSGVSPHAGPCARAPRHHACPSACAQCRLLEVPPRSSSGHTSPPIALQTFAPRPRWSVASAYAAPPLRPAMGHALRIPCAPRHLARTPGCGVGPFGHRRCVCLWGAHRQRTHRQGGGGAQLRAGGSYPARRPPPPADTLRRRRIRRPPPTSIALVLVVPRRKACSPAACHTASAPSVGAAARSLHTGARRMSVAPPGAVCVSLLVQCQPRRMTLPRHAQSVAGGAP